VSLAARISAMAKGGTIFISEIVRALIIGSTDFKLRRLGEFELKGIAGRHVLHEVVWQ
jgi:class 3 adenylate cyclase